MGKNEEHFEASIFFEAQKNYFVFESRLFLKNGHVRNAVSTLPNVVKIDVENNYIVSTLSNAVQFNVKKDSVISFNVDVHNVVSTLT